MSKVPKLDSTDQGDSELVLDSPELVLNAIYRAVPNFYRYVPTISS